MPKYTPESFNEALVYYHRNKKTVSARQVALQYGIPAQTFRDNLKKSPNILTGMVEVGRTNYHKRLFTHSEEQILVNYVLCALRRAHPVTRINLLQAVEALLSKETKPHAIYVAKGDHRNWFLVFRKRHPTLTFRTPENLLQAKLNLSQSVIQQWFSDVRSFFAEKGLIKILSDPTRLFNIDESGFPLSPKSKKVLVERGEKHCFEEVSEDAKMNITVLAAVSPSGLTPPPMIIYPGKTLSKQIRENAPEGIDHFLAHSPRGYITFETLYKYIINYFYDFCVEKKVQFPIIIFTDWHETRSNYYLAVEMKKLGIYMIGLPSNSTHLLQPLDVANFAPMKLLYKEQAKKFNSQHPNLVINQAHFGQVLMPIYYKAMSKENTVSGFRRCGLYPWDAKAPDYTKITPRARQRDHGASHSTKVNRNNLVYGETQFLGEKVSHTDVATNTLPSRENFPPVYGTGETMCDMLLDLKDLRPLKSQKRRLAEELDSGTQFILPDKRRRMFTRQKDVVEVTEIKEESDNFVVLDFPSRSCSRASSRGTSPTRDPSPPSRDSSPSRDPSQPRVLRSPSPMSTGSFDGFDPDDPLVFPEAFTSGTTFRPSTANLEDVSDKESQVNLSGEPEPMEVPVKMENK